MVVQTVRIKRMLKLRKLKQNLPFEKLSNLLPKLKQNLPFGKLAIYLAVLNQMLRIFKANFSMLTILLY